MRAVSEALDRYDDFETWSQRFLEDLTTLNRLANPHRSRITRIAVRDLLRRIGDFEGARPGAVEWEELYACAFAIVARVPRSVIEGNDQHEVSFRRTVQFLKDNAEL